MLKKFIKNFQKRSNTVANEFATNPIAAQNLPPKAFTKKAIELYEKQADIKKFTDMVLQDEITDEFLTNTQAELLMRNIFNPYCEESYKKLAENENLLKDLASDIDNG